MRGRAERVQASALGRGFHPSTTLRAGPAPGLAGHGSPALQAAPTRSHVRCRARPFGPSTSSGSPPATGDSPRAKPRGGRLRVAHARPEAILSRVEGRVPPFDYPQGKRRAWGTGRNARPTGGHCRRSFAPKLPGRALALAAALTLLGSPAGARAFVAGDWIVVEGPGNTLASMARDVGDPTVLSFEPAVGVGSLSRSLRVRGELTIGSEEAWDGLLKHGTILQLDVTECGQARIEVERRPGAVGVLRLVRAKIEAVHRTKDTDECSEANLISTHGKLILDHSTITANIDGQLSPGAELVMRGSTFSFTRSTGLWLQGLEARLVRITDSLSLDNALYGLRLADIIGPLTIRRTVFRGLDADVLAAGLADVTLVDCDFKTAKLTSPHARVVRKWTVTFRLPEPGMVVEARSAAGTGRREVVRGRADAEGTCRLELSECELTAAAPEPRASVNNYTPHDVTIYDATGKTAQFAITNLYVFMPGQEVRLK